VKKAPKKSAKERKAEKREKKLLKKGSKNIELKKVFEESHQ
jgi:hypothetical protein